MKNNPIRFIIIVLLAAFAGACSKSEQDLGKVLFKEFRNPALKETTPVQVAPLLEKMLNEKQLDHGELITGYYRKQGYAPVLLKRYVPDGGIDILLERLEKAGEHGLDSALFQPGQLRQLLDSLENKEKVSTAEAAASLVAELELKLATSLAGYGNALLFGFTDPAEVLPSYYIETKRPDSTSIARLFGADNLESLLDSIQPSGEEYKALQEALAAHGKAKAGEDSPIPSPAAGDTTGGNSARGEETDNPMSAAEERRSIIVNLERLRWKNKPAAEKYVIVNIPDFRLYVMENGSPAMDMKVCVGEPVRRWQTPQLNSLIERVQVNPIWHIPESIASGEIIKKAAADPYYLENANIDVYEDGEIVDDSRKIDWSKVSDEDMPYKFKQRPGSQNALGKIKFLFENQSSVYLHDTPAKAAFDQEMRAVSHGCVRVEKPLELARALFGEGNKFELIKTEMGKENPEARNVELTDKVPIYLVYATCWMDQAGNVQFRPDIYGLDSILFSRLQSARNGQQSER